MRVRKAKEEKGSSSLLMQSLALSFQVGLCLLTNNRKRKGDKEGTQGLLGENEDLEDKSVLGHSCSTPLLQAADRIGAISNDLA
jgi:hypothetical protein